MKIGNTGTEMIANRSPQDPQCTVNDPNPLSTQITLRLSRVCSCYKGILAAHRDGLPRRSMTQRHTINTIHNPGLPITIQLRIRQGIRGRIDQLAGRPRTWLTRLAAYNPSGTARPHRVTHHARVRFIASHATTTQPARGRVRRRGGNPWPERANPTLGSASPRARPSEASSRRGPYRP